MLLTHLYLTRWLCCKLTCADNAAAVKKKLEAEPGAKRLRRTITYTREDGEKGVKEVIYYQARDEDKVWVVFYMGDVHLKHTASALQPLLYS